MAGESPHLLERNWLNIIKIEWTQIYPEEENDKPWQQMINQCPDVFYEGLGIKNGLEVHIHVPEDMKPRNLN